MDWSQFYPQKYFVYGLFNDLINELVYVGVTADPEARLYNHKAVLARDFVDYCRMEILEETGPRNYMQVESFWINTMASLGCNLLNKTNNPIVYEHYLGMDIENLYVTRNRVKYFKKKYHGSDLWDRLNGKQNFVQR